MVKGKKLNNQECRQAAKVAIALAGATLQTHGVAKKGTLYAQMVDLIQLNLKELGKVILPDGVEASDLLGKFILRGKGTPGKAEWEEWSKIKAWMNNTARPSWQQLCREAGSGETAQADVMRRFKDEMREAELQLKKANKQNKGGRGVDQDGEDGDNEASLGDQSTHLYFQVFMQTGPPAPGGEMRFWQTLEEEELAAAKTGAEGGEGLGKRDAMCISRVAQKEQEQTTKYTKRIDESRGGSSRDQALQSMADTYSMDCKASEKRTRITSLRALVSCFPPPQIPHIC